MPDVSIVLLNYNGGGWVAPCLDSVLASDYPSLEVIVVDNASNDGSMAVLREERFKDIKVIQNDANLGFAKAMNIGMKAAQGRYIIPLNFDVTMEPDFISRMVEAAEADERIGSVSGKLLRLNDEGKTDVIDSTGHLIFTNRYCINRGEGQRDTGQFDTPDFVFGTCGAVPLYKREMLDDIAYRGEYYDESFFIMLEDVDLDWRALWRGWNCAYQPRALAYHYRSASAVSTSRLIQRHYFKNRYLLIWKNDAWASALKALPAIWLMDLYLFIDILFTAPVGMLQAWADLIRLTPSTLAKRRRIMGSRKAARSDIEKWFHKYRWMSDVKRKLGMV